jgi:hypothetical protein
VDLAIRTVRAASEYEKFGCSVSLVCELVPELQLLCIWPYIVRMEPACLFCSVGGCVHLQKGGLWAWAGSGAATMELRDCTP